MKLPTATTESQGEQEGDFCHAIEGELVLVEEPCATDRADPDGGCGCGRSFAGLSSHRATTTVVIRDLELTRADVELAVAGYYVSGGSGPDVLGQEEFTELVGDQVRIMMMIGAAAQPGDLVGRRLDRLVYRS